MEDDEDKEEPAPLLTSKPAAAPIAQSAIDVTAEFLRPLLNSENVANLVRSETGSSSACACASAQRAPLHFNTFFFFLFDPGAY